MKNLLIKKHSSRMLTSLFETPTVCAWSKKVIGTIDQNVFLIRATSEIGSLAELRNQPKILRTRMHSSKMRTGHSLTVCWSLLQGGVSDQGGCLLLGGVCSGGVSDLGGVCSGGVSDPGRCLLWGVSAPGELCLRHAPPGTE